MKAAPCTTTCVAAERAGTLLLNGACLHQISDTHWHFVTVQDGIHIHAKKQTEVSSAPCQYTCDGGWSSFHKCQMSAGVYNLDYTCIKH